MENIKWRSGLDMIYLAACALHGKAPSTEYVSKMDLEAVYKQACRHSMDSITFMSVKNVISAETHPELFTKWERSYTLATRKILLFELEREKLITFMEREGIWYLPMKGIILQNYYPALGMRQMADNDIFFDNTRRRDIKKYMTENGFTVKIYGKGAHDVYLKKPVFNFEMHAYLYTESFNDLFFRYYEKINERLIKDEDNKYGYHLSKEDFYIYVITHLFKHFDHGGAGVRFLMDIYSFIKAENENLNWEYIKDELAKLELDKFELSARKLSFKLLSSECVYFGNDDSLLTDSEHQLLDYYIGSGTYGTVQNDVQSALLKLSEGEENNTKKAKRKYILHRLFPNMLYYKDAYPFLYKYKIFIPFFLIFRFVRAILLRPKKIFAQLRIIRKSK